MNQQSQPGKARILFGLIRIMTLVFVFSTLLPANIITIDDEKRLYVDGVPTFVIGFYSVMPKDFPQLAAYEGLNTIHTYYGEGSANAVSCCASSEIWTGGHVLNNVCFDPDTRTQYPASPEQMTVYLDSAAAIGKYVMCGLPRYQKRNNDTDALAMRVNLLKNLPGLLLWYLEDEPHWNGVSASALQTLQNIVSSNDSGHPTIICDVYYYDFMCSDIAAAKSYMNIPDILMTSIYWSSSGGDFTNISRDIFAARTLVEDKKPVWSIVGIEGISDLLRIRCNTYTALASGARGIFYYAYEVSTMYLPDNPTQAASVKRCMSELKELSPILLSTDSGVNAYHVDAGADSPFVLSKSYRYLGVNYLLVVNMKISEVNVAVTPVFGLLPDSVPVKFEDRVIQPSPLGFSERIEQYGVRIYVLNDKDHISAKTMLPSPMFFGLSAMPNPFSAATQIKFNVPQAKNGEKQKVSVRIYDLNGKLVQTLAQGPFTAGYHTAAFNGRDNGNGRTLSNGIYFCRMQAPGFVRTLKLLIVE